MHECMFYLKIQIYIYGKNKLSLSGSMSKDEIVCLRKITRPHIKSTKSADDPSTTLSFIDPEYAQDIKCELLMININKFIFNSNI